ncbi:MAG: iron ABC transporter permease [Erysipelotrichaceae bacterium]|nr:iron ABC transporter permease [Erysipelotrichaceae bacterium]
MNKNKLNVWHIFSLLLLVFDLLFIVYPLFNVLKNSIIIDHQFSLAHFVRFFGDSYYLDTLINSLKVAFVVTLTSLFFGILLAYANTIYELKGSLFLQIVTILCSMSAPFVGAYSWILLLGRGGAITTFLKDVLNVAAPSIYGFGGIVLVMTTKLFPLVYLYVSGALKGIDQSLMEAAENLQCTGFKRFTKVVLPLCMPSILAVALMVFLWAMADFGTPVLIGEGYRTFSVEIYKQYIGEGGMDHGFAAAISIIAIMITAVIFFTQKAVSKRFSFKMDSMHPIQKQKAEGLFGVLLHVYSYLVVAISFMPQLYIIYTSFRNVSKSGNTFVAGYSLNNYKTFLARMGQAVPTTLLIGVVTLALTLVIAVLTAYLIVRRNNKINSALDTLSMIPYIVPGSVVGISMVMGFSTGPLVLTGTMAIMIIAIAIRRMPYTIRSSVATLQQIPLTVEEAAESLGCSKFKTFIKITVPMMMRGIISGAIVSWITILTELSSSIILYSSKTTTLTLSTYIFVSRGTLGPAAASASILTLFTTISLLLFFKLTKSSDLAL